MKFIESVQGLVIEVWSLDKTEEQHVDAAIRILQEFQFIYLDGLPCKKNELINLRNFWLSGSNETRMIYASRTLHLT
jgi:hypothetical protein